MKFLFRFLFFQKEKMKFILPTAAKQAKKKRKTIKQALKFSFWVGPSFYTQIVNNVIAIAHSISAWASCAAVWGLQHLIHPCWDHLIG